MPTNKIHYSGKQSCNNQGFSPLLSSNIEKVTCQGCLNQYHQKNLGGRPPKGEAATHKVAFSISPSAYEKLQKVPSGDRSDFVSKLIENSRGIK
jgi:hypothetical protein